MQALGVSRQAYYQYCWRKQSQVSYNEWVLKLVRLVRQRLPYSGGLNLWRLVKRFLKLFDLPSIGRDRFARLIKDSRLKVRYSKRRGIRTTYSNHSYAVQPNLYKDFEVTSKEQALVADITYLSLPKNKHVYLFLATDPYTRLIAGYHLSDNLSHHGAKIALKDAVSNFSTSHQIIHHTDRGVQYCCHSFLDSLKELGMHSSMTDSDHAAQNALAECINGILKKEFGLWSTFLNFNHAKDAVDEAIYSYNHFRVHGQLKGKTPVEAHYGDYSFINNWAYKEIMPQIGI